MSCEHLPSSNTELSELEQQVQQGDRLDGTGWTRDAAQDSGGAPREECGQDGADDDDNKMIHCLTSVDRKVEYARLFGNWHQESRKL